MSNGKILRYTDPRRFGFGYGPKELEGHNVLAHLGPEPLSDEFNGEYLQQKCAKKRSSGEAWLMDNKLVVGNIYASESLLPLVLFTLTAASSHSRQRCDLLAQVIKAILLRSIEEQGGTTLRRIFCKAMGKPGYFAQGVAAGVRAQRRAIVGYAGTPIVTNETRTACGVLLPSLSEVKRRAGRKETFQLIH